MYVSMLHCMTCPLTLTLFFFYDSMMIRQPSCQPSSHPSRQPSSHPSRPSSQPSRQPTQRPSSKSPTGSHSHTSTVVISTFLLLSVVVITTNLPLNYSIYLPTLQISNEHIHSPLHSSFVSLLLYPGQPSRQPSGRPSILPSSQPTTQPTRQVLRVIPSF